MASNDWVADDSVSAEETMRHFVELGPEPTVGPREGVRLQGGTFRFSGLRIGNGLRVSPTARVSIGR